LDEIAPGYTEPVTRSSSPSSNPQAADDARIWRAGDLGGLELLRATLSEFAFRPHAHEEFFIALTESGLATPTYRGDTHVIGPGDLIVLNPEEAHAGGPPSEGSWTYRALYPHPDHMRELLAEFPGTASTMPEFGGEVVRDREVAARLRRYHRLAERPSSSMLEREAHLAEALVLLVGRHAAHPQAPRSPGREPRTVRRSCEYLEEHAAENVTLEALARFAGLSAFHLCRVFREAVGMTPHAYQTQVRVRRAKSLLPEGRATDRHRRRGGRLLRPGPPHPALQAHRRPDPRPIRQGRHHLTVGSCSMLEQPNQQRRRQALLGLSRDAGAGAASTSTGARTAASMAPLPHTGCLIHACPGPNRPSGIDASPRHKR
jgi:AraC-like DNA-binding protein